MKRVLLCNPYGPYDLEWGENQLDILESRLQRGQGPFTLTSHTHCIALYLIAENINAKTTVLECPHIEDFEEELRKGYDYLGFQIIAINIEKVARMVRMAREISPDTKIILGGYGVMNLYDPPPGETSGDAEYLLKESDYVCEEEGVQFMRKLLGDEPFDRPITQLYLPRGSNSFPGVDGIADRSMSMVLVALGCPNGCEFCCTSAMFKKQKIYVLDPEETFETMKHNCRRNGGQASVALLLDEDLLINPDYMRTLGKLIQEDEEFGLRKLSYFCFGDLRSLSEFSMEELLELGVDSIWVGVESSLDDVITSDHKIEKRTCVDVKSTFETMEKHGIAATASMVLGWDFHTHENIGADIDYFVDLKPSAYQMTFLTACPGTALYERMKKAGRLYPNMTYRDVQQCNDATFIAKHFAPGELKHYFELAHTRLYENNGPGLFRMFEINLNGYETCSQSSRPLLRNEKAAFFAERCVKTYPLTEAMAVYAPTETVREKVRVAQEKYLRLFGEPEEDKGALADLFCNIVGQRVEELEKPKSEEPFDPPVRWTYYDPEKGSVPMVRKGRDAGAPTPYQVFDDPASLPIGSVGTATC